MDIHDIGFDHAYRLALANAAPIGRQKLPVHQAVGHVLAEPVIAKVNSPSVNASLKDGYAVVSPDISGARPDHGIKLKIIGSIAAGDRPNIPMVRGQAFRILTGAPLPEGAEAVLADEFAEINGKYITALADAAPGKNVQPKGEDVSIGARLADIGDLVSPQLVGLLVAGGISEPLVYRKPKVGLLAIGSEILPPGAPLVPGKLYASNVSIQQAWLAGEGFDTEILFSEDSSNEIAAALQKIHAACDVVITSGGAWKGDRDLVVKVLDSLGWEMLFHRTRMAPGKAMAAGSLEDKPVFCLPGGPASNEAAFIMIVFPAILKASGFRRCHYLYLNGRLETGISGQADWTQFIQCEIVQIQPEILLRTNKLKSRLAAIARTPAIVTVPEGVETISAGTQVPFICLDRGIFEWKIRFS